MRNARGEQGVRLGAALVGRQIISPVKIQRVDRVERHELADIDGVRGRVLERLEFLGTEHDVLVLGEFIALDHLRAFHGLSVVHRDVLLLHAGPIFLAQQIE